PGHAQSAEEAAHEVRQAQEPDDGDQEARDLDVGERHRRQGQMGHGQTSSVGGSDPELVRRPPGPLLRQPACSSAKVNTFGSVGSTVTRTQRSGSLVAWVSTRVKLGTATWGPSPSGSAAKGLSIRQM